MHEHPPQNNNKNKQKHFVFVQRIVMHNSPTLERQEAQWQGLVKPLVHFCSNTIWFLQCCRLSGGCPQQGFLMQVSLSQQTQHWQGRTLPSELPLLLVREKEARVTCARAELQESPWAWSLIPCWGASMCLSLDWVAMNVLVSVLSLA